MKSGQQVRYTPGHVKEASYVSCEIAALVAGVDPLFVLKHDDQEIGFVVSVSGDGRTAFCRYWKRYTFRGKVELRTKSCSEATNILDLAAIGELVPQHWVDYLLGSNDWSRVFTDADSAVVQSARDCPDCGELLARDDDPRGCRTAMRDFLGLGGESGR